MSRRYWIMLTIAVGLTGSQMGCATVRPYEREFLVDPIMAYELDSKENARESKWLEAREGSAGGSGGAGGGCACN